MRKPLDFTIPVYIEEFNRLNYAVPYPETVYMEEIYLPRLYFCFQIDKNIRDFLAKNNLLTQFQKKLTDTVEKTILTELNKEVDKLIIAWEEYKKYGKPLEGQTKQLLDKILKETNEVK
jgi:hypothetical protein